MFSGFCTHYPCSQIFGMDWPTGVGGRGLCYPGVWLRDGGRVRSQQECGLQGEGVSLQRNGLHDRCHSSQSIPPSSCLHPVLLILQCPGTIPPHGYPRLCSLLRRGTGGWKEWSSLPMALDLPELPERQGELAVLSWHMTQLPLK